MTYSSTFRTDVRTALAALLSSFQSANPTLLHQSYRARPPALYPPCAFIGTWSEPTVTISSGVTNRRPLVEIVFVQGEYDNAETMDRQDVLADALLSFFADPTQAHLANGYIESLSLNDVDLTIPGAAGAPNVTYLATVLTLQLDILEGRQ